MWPSSAIYSKRTFMLISAFIREFLGDSRRIRRELQGNLKRPCGEFGENLSKCW